MADRLPRKLAAILYADVAGYSRLTGEDEDATHLALSEYLDLISTIIESHGGQVMLFGWVPVLHSEYGFHSGAFEHDGSRMYVGRGLGVTVLPVRMGARSEVPIITLVR